MTRALSSQEIASDDEWETGNVIVERFASIDPAEIPAVLVRNHGPFAWGPSGPKAVENATALEIVAQMALHALQLEPSAPAISRELIDKHVLRKHGHTAYDGQGNAGEKSPPHPARQEAR